MGRSKLKSLKETTLATFFELSSKLGISNQFIYNAQSGVIKWNNGSEIILKDLFLYPSDPEFDSLGSLEITGGFIDECNQVTKKAWQIVLSRCRFKLQEFNLIPKVLGTCNPAKNWVYLDFYEPNKKESLVNSKKFIQALPTDNPHLPPSYLDSLLALDKNSRERLYYGNWEFDDDPLALLSFEKILELWENDHVKRNGVYYISADIARFGSDKAVIVVWDGLTVVDILSYNKSSAVLLQDKIKELRMKYSIPKTRCIADEDGVGGGIVDNLGIIGFKNNGKVLGKENYQNLKTQCYFKLCDNINSNNICINTLDNKEHLIKELELIKRESTDKDNKIKLQSKDEVKKVLGHSPDFTDALMMRMWFELPRRTKKAKISIN
jgi:hypothetical protein